MPVLGTKKYIVTVRQGRIKPQGGVEGWLDRRYTVYAKTSRGARSAVKSAGIRGEVVEAKLGGSDVER